MTGETKSYSESYRFNELAIIDTTDLKFDDVVAVPEELLKPGSALQHPKLPFRVVVKEYYPNTALSMRRNIPGEPPSLATAGIGPQVVATPVPLTYKPDERNWPAAYIELIGAEGSLGTWLALAPAAGAADLRLRRPQLAARAAFPARLQAFLAHPAEVHARYLPRDGHPEELFQPPAAHHARRQGRTVTCSST